MGLFDFKDYKVVLHPDSVAIPPFRELWERDKTKHKHKATQELSYVYFVCDFKSPYAIYNEKERPRKVKSDFIKDSDWEEDDLVKDAMKKYNEFQETYTMKFFYSARGLSEKLQAYFDEVDFAVMDEKGKPVYSAKDAMANLQKVGDVIESLNKVEDKVKKEIDDKAKIKGKKQIRSRER